MGLVPDDKTLRLTIPEASRVKDAVIPYAASDDEEALRNNAAIHLDETGFPWEREANVYVAGHRLGYPGTNSFLAFYGLLRPGQAGEGRRGLSHRLGGQTVRLPGLQGLHRGSDGYVCHQPIEGKNIVTLQTCTLPNYSQRLIVQAEKVA